MAAPPQTPRERLTRRIAQHLVERNSTDFSLRELGEAVGSSHRMLRYHFTDRAGILAAVAAHLELRLQQPFEAAAFDVDTSPQDVIWSMYRALTDPAEDRSTRLCFELWVRGLEQPGTETVLFAAWLPTLTAFAHRLGLDGDAAATEARLILATAHGIMLDVLTTGDRDAADAMVRAFVARYPAAA